MLSIVIPTLNESKTGCLSNILAAYQCLTDCEIICVDGGSYDGTIEVIKRFKARLISTTIASRAGRLNQGIKHAQYDMVLLHHPRSILDIAGIVTLQHNFSQIEWGAFTQQFAIRHPLLDFTSWYSNHIRGDRRGVYYLDHCLFAKRQLLLDVGLLPDIDIFEDTELCLRLNKKAKGIRLPFVSLTSAIRFQSQGVYRQSVKNQFLKWLYYFGRSDKKMNQLYERNLALNTKYDSNSDQSK